MHTGILMWEVFTGGVMPYDKMKNVDVVDYVCTSGKRLEKPAQCPEKIYKVMMQCWHKVSIIISNFIIKVVFFIELLIIQLIIHTHHLHRSQTNLPKNNFHTFNM